MCARVADLIWTATEGREYVQQGDFSIETTSRDNAWAIKLLKATRPVTNTQRRALRSVVGILAWVARAARPDFYRVNAVQTSNLDLQGYGPNPREANGVTELALKLKDGVRAILFKAGQASLIGELGFCCGTFSNASFVAAARIISFGSFTVKRTHRAMPQCHSMVIAFALSSSNFLVDCHA